MTSSIEQEEELPGDDLEVLSSLRSRDYRRNRIKNLKRFQLQDNSDDSDSDSDNLLSGNSHYTLTLKQQSLEEMEQEEEIELCKTIKNINLKYKEQNQGLSNPSNKIQHSSSSEDSYDFANSSEEENEDKNNNNDIDLSALDTNKNSKSTLKKNSSGSDCSFHSSNTLSTFSNTIMQDDSNINLRESFISQNLIVYDELIKMIVIGSKGAGKTLFIKKIMNEDINTSCIPTTTLEIKKTIINVNNKKVKLEFFDTNTQIINSGIIKTYYKISQGYIAIIDSLPSVDNMLFLKKQIEEIQSAKTYHEKIFLVVNSNDNNINLKKAGNNKKEEVMNDFLKELQEKYFVLVKKCDISRKELLSDEDFIQYLNDILFTKKMIETKRNSNQIPQNISDNIRRGSDNTLLLHSKSLRSSPQAKSIKSGTLYLSPKERKLYQKILI